MEGRNYLEQLQFKKQAKKPPVINIDFGEKSKSTKTAKVADKPKVVELEEGELEEGEIDKDVRDESSAKKEPEHRKEMHLKDLRGKVPVDYELIMKRLQTHNITGVVNMVSVKPGIQLLSPSISAAIQKPIITKTTTKAVIEDEEEPGSPKISLEKSIDESPESVTGTDIFGPLSDSDSDSESEPEPPVAAPEPQAAPPKKKIVIKGKIDLPGPAKQKKQEATKDAAKQKVAEEEGEDAAAAAPPGAPKAPGEPTKRGRPRGRQTKKAANAVAIKLSKAEIARRLPKQEKLVVKTSQYYMNNRKLYVHKIRELFKPYEKELAAIDENASCEKDPSANFSPLTHQKIVRDYLNLYTPYRGLLLYHGLGAGKTCTSIGIAEGMKSAKEIVMMTPASLATNYFTEIKKCGDVLYRKNQFWEFVGIEGQPDNVELLSKALSLPADFIEKKGGAWLVDVKKPPNFKDLTTVEQESIDEQLDKMIRAKYTDIHYNGINRRVMNIITQNKTINPFDNKTVIIDEVHNFVSRIVNKLESKKPDVISKELYQYLLTANNARIVVLSGTPIINTPDELSVLFNILRGAIRTWTIPVRHKEGKKITKEDILDMLNNPPAGIPSVTEYDYVDFGDNKITITRNPLGFVNTKRREAKGKAGGGLGILGNLFGGGGEKKHAKTAKKIVEKTAEKAKSSKKTTKKNHPKPKDGNYSAYEIVNGVLKIKDIPKEPISEDEDIDYYQRSGHDLHKDGGAKDEFDKYTGVKLDESGYVSDDQFLDAVKRILKANEIDVLEKMMKDQPVYNTALPDDSKTFDTMFVDNDNKTIANPNVFKRRILGLTSYFRSAQESLLPRIVMNGDKTFHIEKVEMSEHQLDEYAYRRFLEVEEKKNRAKNKNRQPKEGEAETEQENSTYRVWTREVCNFTFPQDISRPIPDKKLTKKQMEKATKDLEKELGNVDKSRVIGPNATLKQIRKAIGESSADEDSENSESDDDENTESISLDSIDGSENGDDMERFMTILQEHAEKAEKMTSAEHAEFIKRIKEALKQNAPKSDKDESKYMDRIKTVLRKLAYDPAKPKSEQYLTKEGMLGSLSPKLLKMLENIQNPENEGLHLVYSQFRHIEGIGIMKAILEANGYAEFKIKSVPGAESWELVENEEDVGKPKFALYTGTESEEEKEIIRNIYNGDWGFVPKSISDKLEKISKNNLYGEIIKVLMITAAGAEGINLRNTRFVHITEPYWHNTRLEQVIGRARRICSHEQLPEKLRTIKVFLYVTAFGEELMDKVPNFIQTGDIDPTDLTHVETTDEYLLRIATKKETLNKAFLKAIKESAMDCTLYKNKEGLMCYGVGMDKNPGNQFLSHPTVEQDLAERDDLNVKKTVLKLAVLNTEIRGVKYAIDKATDNLYDLAKYQNNNDIELIGKLIRPGKGKTGYDIEFVRK
uniref:Helicase ATP-binding domain-containing protein n=1 Tax=viral metagenome TaxID=1070528 RepID=A0A6C0HIL0_9ZZZZ